MDGREAKARYADGILRIPLDPGVAPGGPTRVEVVYEGTPDDGLILGENVHGRPSAFVDNWPNRARFWFPSVDHPRDKATASLTVHAPESWVVVASGRRLGEPVTEAAGVRTWRWRTDVAVSAYNLLTATTLGEALAAAGERVLVASSGSTGFSYPLNRRVAGGAILHYDYGLPETLYGQALELLGDVPAAGTPNDAKKPLDRRLVSPGRSGGGRTGGDTDVAERPGHYRASTRHRAPDDR